MNQEFEQSRSAKQAGKDQQWLKTDLSDLFDGEKSNQLFSELKSQKEIVPVEKEKETICAFPDFGAATLKGKGVAKLNGRLREELRDSLQGLGTLPSLEIFKKQEAIWRRVVMATETFYTTSCLKGTLSKLTEEAQTDEKKKDQEQENATKKQTMTSNDVLIEVGVKTSLSLVFSLLKQVWGQLSWQRQLHTLLTNSGSLDGSLLPYPEVQLPYDVLQSVIDVLRSLPPLSLNKSTSLSPLGQFSLDKGHEFLKWLLDPTSGTDDSTHRLAMEISLLLSLHEGTLTSLLKWFNFCFSCLSSYPLDVPLPSLSHDVCSYAISEIQKQTNTDESRDLKSFVPIETTSAGHVSLIEFISFLAEDLYDACKVCTETFCGDGASNKPPALQQGKYISTKCDVYAFGSNSSSQLAMGSTEKFMKATLLTHMANAQFIEAGQYCTFLIFSDGSMKGCGKGSYGRLGLGNSESQPTLKDIDTFPENTLIQKLASSRGSDGHSLAIDKIGNVYSWGDGEHGKLGHNNNVTLKTPKLIQFFVGKIITQVSCGNRHSAAISSDNELYTWGEGDYGRLGHGSTTVIKVPTKVTSIGLVQKVSCGCSHTLALSVDGSNIWSFGSGDSGKLGHGDTNKVTSPKIIEHLKGQVFVKICAANQFSLVLSVTGKVYSFGKGSAIGNGTTDVVHSTPLLIDALSAEYIVDIDTGDGHCLALTQRGDVFAWGTNSMGQCGQGHSNSSITKPSKVMGLDNIQIQQISAGTSHSIVWTAVPRDRRATTVWQWPYCIKVEEELFEQLINLINQYWNINSTPILPFTSNKMQESFVYNILSLLKVHMSLVVPLGQSSVHMACGKHVSALRNLLLQLMDSHLTPSLDEVCSESFNVGSSVLMPPVLDRLRLILNLLPSDPTQFSTLSGGQKRQLDLLLNGFIDEKYSCQGDISGLLADDECLDFYTSPQSKNLSRWKGSVASGDLFTLCQRMSQYIKHVHMRSLDGAVISLEGSQSVLPAVDIPCNIVSSFQRFILLAYQHVLSFLNVHHQILNPEEFKMNEWAPSLNDTQVSRAYIEPFVDIVRDVCLSLLLTISSSCKDHKDPVKFIVDNKEVLTSFICTGLPTHIALSVITTSSTRIKFILESLFLDLAKATHSILSVNSDVVKKLDMSEIEHSSLQSLENVDSVWIYLVHFQQTMTYSAGRLLENLGNVFKFSVSAEFLIRNTKIDKEKALRDGHIVCLPSGTDNDRIAQALCMWYKLCKALPKPSDDPECLWCDISSEFTQWNTTSTSDGVYLPSPDYSSYEEVPPIDIECCNVLEALAVGAIDSHGDANKLYTDMMNWACSKDLNTATDEESVPQLKQVSCAALACYIHHCGLLHLAMTSSSSSLKPHKSLVDVYRAVFSLRKEIFMKRPVPNNEGKIPDEEQTKFTDVCIGICTMFLFLMNMLDRALPEETTPIVPQIAPTNTIAERQVSVDTILTAGTTVSNKPTTGRSLMRLFSHPAGGLTKIQEGTDGGDGEGPEAAILGSSTFSSDSNIESTKEWSLTEVKNALSLLQWQRERVKQQAQKSSQLCSLSTKVCSFFNSLVLMIFNEETEATASDIRDEILYLLVQQTLRATRLQSILESLKSFLSCFNNENSLLHSSKLLYLIHGPVNNFIPSKEYDVPHASLSLQHQVKSIYHSVLMELVSPLYDLPMEQSHVDVLSQNNLLLSLLWLYTVHEPDDLKVILNGDLYKNLALSSGTVNTFLLPRTLIVDGPLAPSLQQASLKALQSLAIQTVITKELSSDDNILTTICEVLYGQLEGYINMDNPVISSAWNTKNCSRDEREKLLKDYLSFLNTLLEVSDTIFAVVSSPKWFQLLLSIVNVDSESGEMCVSSVKTCLVAIQLLQSILVKSHNESYTQPQCDEILSSLFDLLYKVMFYGPSKSISCGQSQPNAESKSNIAEIHPIPFKLSRSENFSSTLDDTKGDCLLKSESTGGYTVSWAIGSTPLNKGKYSWKVTPTTSNPAFCVGICISSIDNFQVRNSPQLWALEVSTGVLLHDGETGEIIPYFQSIKENDEVIITYDADNRTLGFGINDKPVSTFFTIPPLNAFVLHPIVVCDKPHNRTQVLVHSFKTSNIDIDVKTGDDPTLTNDRESGYPTLAPSMVALSQAIVGIVHLLQDKEKWRESLQNRLRSKLQEMNTLVERLVMFHSNEAESLPSLEFNEKCSVLIRNLCEHVWPCLAVMGGVDPGFRVGGACSYTEGTDIINGVITGSNKTNSIYIQALKPADDESKNITKVLSDLKLSPSTTFDYSIILHSITPLTIMNISLLSGIIDHPHTPQSIIASLKSSTNDKATPIPLSSGVPYMVWCEHRLRYCALKTLENIMTLEENMKLITGGDKDGVGGDDKIIEMKDTMIDILRCMVEHAVKPSTLIHVLKPVELERVLSILSYHHLIKLAANDIPEEVITPNTAKGPPPPPPLLPLLSLFI